MEALKKFVELDKKELSILVVGDALLDQYFDDIKVERICPEAPIPIYLSETDVPREIPGGAANTAFQFKHFNLKVSLASFVDEQAKAIFNKNDIDTDLCVQIDTKIPRKIRFYSDDFLVQRWDIEKKNYGMSPEDLNKKCLELYDKIKNIVHKFDVVVFSDYNKGVFINHVNKLVSLATFTIVDPKSNIDLWQGCTIFKPNAKEAITLTGTKTVKEAGFVLLKKLNCQSVVVTESALGATVFDKNGYYEIRTKKIEGTNFVSGAGDCFTAFLAMGVGCAMPTRTAAEIAVNAGNLYVKNKHNKPLKPTDLF